MTRALVVFESLFGDAPSSPAGGPATQGRRSGYASSCYGAS